MSPTRIWIAGLCVLSAGMVRAEPPYYADVARAFARVLPRQHLTHHPLDDSISARAWTNYLAVLDPDGGGFTPSDLDAFAAQRLTLDDALRRGDVSFAYEARAVLAQRARERGGADAGPPDAEQVLETYLTAFARAYDPHSAYWSASTLEDGNIQRSLSLVGIGVVLAIQDGMPTVMGLVADGPAARDKRPVRLRPGDRITAVAQEGEVPQSTAGLPLRRVVRMIRGEAGSRVVLSVMAPDEETAALREVSLARAGMDVQERAARGALLETRAAKNVTRRLGVIELGAFYGKSGGAGRSAAEDVERIIGDLQARKAQGLILDLRDNGGGYLREAVRVAGLFIAGGPVLQTRGRRLETVSDPHPSVCYAGPLVVLVNGQTASAAEAVAAALQDYGRAVVVGDSRTGGKVTCQTTYRLGDDPRWGAARLTTLVYYRITGGVPWTEGIEPDIKLPAASAVPSPRPTAGEPGEWPAAKAVRYEPVADLRPTIAALRVKSARRAGERAVSAADDPDLAEALAVMGDLLAPGGARAE